MSMRAGAKAARGGPRAGSPSAPTWTVRLTAAITLTSLMALAASAQEAPLPTGVVPEEPDGHIAVDARNSTVRPGARQFSPDLLSALTLPEGFRISVFAEGLEEPRTIVVHENGDVYIAERSAGQVRLLRDTDGDGRADDSRVVASGLGQDLEGVHGLAIREGWLYMVTETELYRAQIGAGGDLGDVERLSDDIPAGGQHPNRTLGFSPTGEMFLSIGSTCNACVEPQDDHAALHRVADDGSRTLFAEGLRNTIAFGWHPATGDLWGLDHNSDGRGEDWPPEELNRIVEGEHYGWPFCGGDREPDHQVSQDPSDPRPMTKQEFCATTQGPELVYTAHAAPMQVVFYEGDAFPAEYRHDAFATMRGSWNRNPPSGYEVVRIRFDDAGAPTGIESFITGWLLEEGRAHGGRLMGLAATPDGALLLGDDANGVVLKVEYDGG